MHMATQGIYPEDPKLKDLVYELKEVDWKQLGIQLNVPRHILRNIDRENSGNESRKLSEVLQYWIDNAEPAASWKTILIALQRIGGHKNIITSIRSKYTISCKPQGRISESLSTSRSDESDRQIVSISQTAEGGVSVGRVSARPIHSLKEQLSKFPAQLLDSPCANSDLVKSSQSVSEWQDLAPYMQLTLAEERGILTASPQVTPARQCSEMFRIWRERLGHNANYRCLINILHEANRMDLINKLHQLIVLEQLPTHQPQLASHSLDWYGSYLKKQYVEVLFTQQVSANKWLPSPTQKIFNLAIIKKEKIQRGEVDDEFVRKTLKGQVDDILLEKSHIELKDIFKNVVGERKVILIDGAPGSGKSTLTVNICQQWSRGELFKEFTVVILIHLRDPEVQNATSLTKLLPARDFTMAEQAAREMFENEGSGVLWILDGYDELPLRLQGGSIISTLIKPKHNENPLSKTTVIVTSRPISSGDLCPLVSSRIEVLGFTAEEQRLFFTECLNNDTKAVETLMERLSSNPAMEGSCYLPLNASIVAHLYQVNRSLPSTIYGIFSSLVQHCLSRYLHERQGVSQKLATFESLDRLPDQLRSFFEQICKLAFTGARDNRVTFSTSEIQAIGGSSDEICKLGLLQAVPSIVSHGRSVYHNFLHLSIQEMLAAVHISRMPASEQISTFDSMFNYARFSAVLQFYAAITKFHTSRPLLSLVPRFLRPVPASIYDLVRKIIRKNSRSLLISLLNCLYEAQDTALCKYVGEQLRDKVPFLDRFGGFGYGLKIKFVSLLPQDCLSIGYFLASIAVSYKGKFTVNFGHCSLRDTGIKILMQSFCRSLDPHSEVTGHLDMYIYDNEFTREGASYIAEALRTTRALRKLYINFQYLWSRNPIGDKGLQYIAEALITNTSLVELYMWCCSLRITEENGPTLTEMLQRNKTLRILDLSHNEAISDNAASFIIEGLKKNTTLKTLNLYGCSITDEGIRLIQSSTSTCKIINYRAQ